MTRGRGGREGVLVLLLLGFILCAALVDSAHGLVRGDLVKTSTRARYGKVETPWTGLTSKYSPRFRYDRAAHLPNPEQIMQQDFFKLSFSFMDERFITPWITVWDPKQNLYLNYVEFVFTYSGDDIIGVDYHVDYNNEPEHAGKVLPNLLLRGLEDAETMMALLLCGGFVVSLATVLCVVISTSAHLQTIGSMMREEERSTKSSLPYVDTSNYEYSPTRGHSEGQNRSFRQMDDRAQEEVPRTWTTSTGRMVQESEGVRDVRDHESTIPMEDLPTVESDPTIVDDFVNLETSSLPPSFATNASSTPLTYLQQPLVSKPERKGHGGKED